MAIDGPSGSGKSTVSRRVAARLGLRFLDTGAIYRALTWWCLDQGVDLADQAAVVATNLEVRATLREVQRQLIAEGPRGTVAEGRDITTVIAPDADVRILLTADARARLERRAAELHGDTGEAALDATRDQVLRRDRDDSTVSSFLTAAEGVVTIDSSALDLDGVVDAVLAEVEARTGVRPDEVTS